MDEPVEGRLLTEHLAIVAQLDVLWPAVHRAAKGITQAIDDGNLVLWMGNGGSAALAQHLAAELVGRFERRERAPWPSIALTADGALLTAVANDFGFLDVFARQIRALGRTGDVLIGMSTSGSSANIAEALREAKQRGLGTIALTGAERGQVGASAEICLAVPSRSAARVQEAHLFLGHLICTLVEEALGDDGGVAGRSGGAGGLDGRAGLRPHPGGR